MSLSTSSYRGMLLVFFRAQSELYKCIYGRVKDECGATASAIYTEYLLTWERRSLPGCYTSAWILCMHLTSWYICYIINFFGMCTNRMHLVKIIRNWHVSISNLNSCIGHDFLVVSYCILIEFNMQLVCDRLFPWRMPWKCWGRVLWIPSWSTIEWGV